MQPNLSPIDRDMLIRTVIGEAANEPLKGQAGVVYSVLNRMTSGRYGGSDAQSVIFKKNAYEPWTKRRSELLAYKPESDSYKRAAGVVDAVLGGQIKDPTGGATHFLNPKVVEERRGGSLPKWAQGEGTAIGQHTFFAPDGAVQQVADRQAVSDPAILEAFGTPEETQPTQTAGAITDSNILKEFNLPAPDDNVIRDASGTPQFAPGTPAEPILPGREAGMGAFFIQGFASNEQEGLRALAQSLYPDEPIDQAVQRFGKEGGTLYHVGDDGQRYRVNPEGWSIQDVLNQVVQGAGKAIPTLAGAATGIATAPAAMAGPGGLAASLVATGTAAGGGEYVRQKLGDVMMGEASTGDVSPLQVASEAGSALAGQGAGAGFGKLATRGAVRDIARYDPIATAQAYSEAAVRGISLTPAEATGIASLKAQQKRLLNTMETADTMADFFTLRDTEVKTAWTGLLDTISVASDAEVVGKLARDAADGVFADMRRALSAKAKPFYDKAFAQVVPVTDTLRDLMGRPVMADAFKGAKKMAENEGRTFNAEQPSMQDWDYVKRAMDDILDSNVAMNERTGGRNQHGRVVNNIRSDMLSELDGLNPDYAMARSIYATGAEDVTGAMQSALAALSKTKDTNILNAARHIFDPKTRSPNMVVKLRSALEGKDPDAWQAIKRLYIQDVGMDALRVAETGEVLNPAGKLYKAFSNDKLRENLRPAMTQAEWQEMNGLLVVLKRASSVPALRSDTAFNLWAREAERTVAEGVPSKVLKNLNPMQALRNVAEWRTTKRMDRNAARLAEIITSNDPESVMAMRELRRLSPWDKRWLIIFGHLIGQGGGAAAESLMPEPDFAASGGVGGGGYQ